MDPDLDVPVLPSEAGLMIKEIIYGRLNLSRGLLRRMKNGGKVCLNGEETFITQRVEAGDRITIFFADAPTNITPEALDLEILYEDESVLVINKASDMAVYPTRSYPEGTLVNGVAYLWQKQGLQRKIRLLHRLDRETSGAILIAKEPYAYHHLVTQLRSHKLRRKYLGIVAGVMEEKEGLIDQPIGRSQNMGHALKRAVSDQGKAGQTYFRLLQAYDGVSLVELELLTGRTHQIRVHLAWLGYPILGDGMYGERSRLIKRQALHAWSLQFIHPRTKEELLIRAPLPDDMLRALNNIL